MKNCKYCGKEFQPRSNRQAVCGSTKCKNKLNAKKMQRYRNSDRYKQRQIQRQKSIIYEIVRKQGYATLYDIISKTQFKPIIVRARIKSLIKNRKLNQSFDRYHESYEKKYSLWPQFFFLNGYKIKIPAYPNFKYRFLDFLEASGLEITDDNMITGFEDLRTAIRICQIAYASIWSEQLAIKLYDQFVLTGNKGCEQVDDAIGFFLHHYNNLAKCRLTPKGYENWNASSFTDNITVELIKFFEKQGRQEQNQSKISREEITNFLKQIHNVLSKQVYDFPVEKYNKEELNYLKGLLDDLLCFSNNKIISNRIFYAVLKTIETHGKPFLPIEKIQ